MEDASTSLFGKMTSKWGPKEEDKLLVWTLTCLRVIGQGPQNPENMRKMGFWCMGKQKQCE